VRDIALVMVFAVLIPAIFFRHWLGPLVWAWVSMMNPHRLTYGFAYNLPFAEIVAGATLLTLPFTKNKRRFPVCAPTVFMVLFILWTGVTTVYAINSSGASFAMWEKVIKVHIMLWATLMMIVGRRQLMWLIWVIAFSVGIYGIKGGIWTVVTGGANRVWGPTGSFIEGNNELALALIVVLPLMFFLRGEIKSILGRYLMTAAMVCIGFSVLGSHSRGALLAIIVMALFLGLKSARPMLMTLLTFAVLGGLVAFMPENWSGRMATIESHMDGSAQSRLETWRMIWNLVQYRPINGAGFELATPEVWARYATEAWTLPYSPHSIYFQALGEHGFVGLFLYLGIGIATWRMASRVIRAVQDRSDLEWAVRLMRAIQVSLISFATGGAFLNLVSYDLPYYLVGIVAIVWRDIQIDYGIQLGAVALRRPSPSSIVPVEKT